MRLIDPGKDTLVFMKNAEPISLYCADETDGESLDTCQQILEGAVPLQCRRRCRAGPGRQNVQPMKT